MTPKLSDFTVKQLHVILKYCTSNDSIGFDPCKDTRTALKEPLMAYIAVNYSDAVIASAVTRLRSERDAVTLPNTPTQEQNNNLDNKSASQKMADAIQAAIEASTGKQTVDAETVRAIVKSEVEKITFPVVVQTHNNQTNVTTDCGIQHKKFPLLLQACQATTDDGHRLNFWLKGPAGTGKTTAAKHCAKALALPFQFNGAISTAYELMGYRDAGGTYHRTAFREVYEHGGVYLFDEIDSSDPRAVLAFNAALANGVCRFPDGMIERHKDCVVLAGANTAGTGATVEYNGRMKQDAAFLDRFLVITWELDMALESALSSNKEWLDIVREVRGNVESRKLKGHLVTPRANIFGAALLKAGISLADVQEMALRKGLSDDQWKEIKPC